MNKKLKIGTPINLIQTIRLVHALCESEFTVTILPAELYKFQILKDKFLIPILSAREDEKAVDLSEYIIIDHKKPSTSIGTLTKTLIFPNTITKYCKSLWLDKRPNRYTFTGLILDNRKESLQKFITKNIELGGSTYSLNFETFFSKLRDKVLSVLGIDNTIRKKIGNLIISSSSRGRKYPEKSWDEAYFKTLAESEFVLCPSGKYAWSYRFFEAILCGAIPIIEENCEAYEGFVFHYMHDDVTGIQYSAADAEYNYILCLERVTIPAQQLNKELETIAASYKAHNK